LRIHQLNRGGRRIIPLLRAIVFDSFQGRILERSFAETIQGGGPLDKYAVELLSVVKEMLEGLVNRT
jgi:hypothetical protein